MPSLVQFETMPQLYLGLVDRFRGQNRTVLRYKNVKTKEWIGITWDELHQQVTAMAGFLHSQGIRHGDRVGIISENRPEWAVTDLATQLLGAVNVSLYTTLPTSQASYIVKDSGSKVFVASTSYQVRKARELFDDCPDLKTVVAMSALRKEGEDHMLQWNDVLAQGAAYFAEHEAEIMGMAEATKPHDISALIYTSGTTGTPKGVMLTHQNFSRNVLSSLERLPLFETDHHLSFLPLCHSFERVGGYIAMLAAGVTISYAESVDAVSKNLPEVRPTVMVSVPRLFERVYNVIAKSVEEGSPMKKRIFDWSVATGSKYAKAELNGGAGFFLSQKKAIAHKLVFSKLHEKLGGRVQYAVSGGAALPKAIGEFFLAAGIKIIEGYGLTETSPVLSFNPMDAPRYGTVGHVLPEVTIGIQSLTDGSIIAEQTGEAYPSNLTSEAGEIVAKGPNIMKGYWNNDEATAEAIDADGWYHSGDVGRFEDGYLRITDRIKHMMVSKGGKNIYPGPIEETFKTFPFIDQITVIGEGREYLTALVVPSHDAVRQYAKDNNVPHSGIKDLVAHDDIRAIYKKEFRRYSRQAASHEKIRDFALIEEPFTVDNGMMTPTMKLKRRSIEGHYADVIDEMYAGVI
ncbi:MAG: long-chain fatty acid--CoA ligase [Bacteroidota bacterium]